MGSERVGYGQLGTQSEPIVFLHLMEANKGGMRRMKRMTRKSETGNRA